MTLMAINTFRNEILAFLLMCIYMYMYTPHKSHCTMVKDKVFSNAPISHDIHVTTIKCS